MASPTQSEQTTKFRALHRGFLLLANGWDAASARMAEEAGDQAVASSSAAVAWCHGYADGEAMPHEVVMTATREMLRVITVPLTVDSEAGYSSDPGEVAAYVSALIGLGVAGINIEDGRDPPELLAAKIKAIRATRKDIFINARCDVYLKNLGPDDQKLAEMIRRGKLYAEAGADGFFAPGMANLADIGDVVKAVTLPVNCLVMRALPPIADLKKIGVRRISTGAQIGCAAYGAAVRGIRQFLDESKPDAIFANSGDCPNFNALFKPA
ncbi:MAG TPA: isocitrate lyase/phosphoenolpyruvate mutase family protein [Rhizomicrobium sp.]|jgi:2-methylisocitrate lyase-like PEP mutase family enzyme